MQNRTRVKPVVMMAVPIQSGPPVTFALAFLGAVQTVQRNDRVLRPASTANVPLHLIAESPVGRPPKIVPMADPRGAPALQNRTNEGQVVSRAAKTRPFVTHASVIYVNIVSKRNSDGYGGQGRLLTISKCFGSELVSFNDGQSVCNDPEA